MTKTPFTIFDADIYLYKVDASDNPTEEVYIGACAESARFNQSFTLRRLEYHGLRYAREYHEDEEHAIELKNVWLHDRSAPVSRMPKGHERNQRYALVIIWQDPDAGVWTKRTYFGVTSHGQQLEETMESLPFRAESCIEQAGLIEDGLPSGVPSITGIVRYVGEDGTVDLYSYEADGAVLTVIDEALLEGRAAIALDAGAHTGEITFDGVRALWANGTRTEVSLLQALGSTVLDEEPRLEFFLNEVRVASLGASGTLEVANLREAADPGLPDFELRAGGTRLFSFSAGRCYVPSITEVEPP